MVITQNSCSQDETVKVRFAPSPTGHPHIGNIRIAEYNYLFAKKHKGKFYLRLEDTDRERSKKEYEDSIQEALHWLELYYEKEVWRQSERTAIYEKYANKLIEEKKVYYCNCTNVEECEEDTEESDEGKKYKCDCLGKHFTSGALRFIVPTDKKLELMDMILGSIVINSNTLENFVVRRKDGTYPYNFAVTVDDLERGITHVIRGNDHVYNTFKQLLLYEAFGARPPLFAHVPLIGGADGKKLSKRLGTGEILAYRREMGISADGMFNYLARLSGGYGDQEILSREEAIESFDITKISKSQAAFDLDKLLHLSGHYISHNPKKHFAELMIFLREVSGLHASVENFLRINQLLTEFAKRSKTLKELAESLMFIYKDLEISQENMEHLNKPLLHQIIKTLENVPDYDPETNNEYFQISGDQWNEEHLHKILKEKFPNNLSEVCQQIRISLLNTNASPSTFLILAHLGKRDTLRKLQSAAKLVE